MSSLDLLIMLAINPFYVCGIADVDSPIIGLFNAEFCPWCAERVQKGLETSDLGPHDGSMSSGFQKEAIMRVTDVDLQLYSVCNFLCRS